MAFPGPNPGTSQALVQNGKAVLSNKLMSVSWSFAKNGIQPLEIVNKLTACRYSQSKSSFIRLISEEPKIVAGNGPLRVAIRLSKDKVQVLSGQNALRPIASFPRAKFSRAPSQVRIGKLNLKGLPQDYPDPGQFGTCKISDIRTQAGPVDLAKGTILKSERQGTKVEIGSNSISIDATGNSGAAWQAAAPAELKEMSCTIDKGTDHGMSWSPALALAWPDGQFVLVGVRDSQSRTLNVTTIGGETMLNAERADYPAFIDNSQPKLSLIGLPKVKAIKANPKGVRIADRIGGKRIDAALSVLGTDLRIAWTAELRDESNYIRQTFKLSTKGKDQPLRGIELVSSQVPDVETIGSCPGSPAAGSGLFFGVELPGARNLTESNSVRIGAECKLTVSKDQAYSFSSVLGIAPKGQLRRSFLRYIERERARPSSPFLHYNCWYDLGFSVSAEGMIDVIKQFDKELVKKRGVPVLSYLIDDGWDDPDKDLWQENQEKFCGGFKALKAKTDSMSANLAIWFSPLGGYGGANERTQLAQKMGLIPAGSGLDFAQPAYKKWFQERCIQLMKEGGVNAFKWDRAGEGVSPHFMALLDIAHNLKQVNPNLFINVTVGTWPSPFWLNHVDTTWRMNSADVGWAGVGDDREKWITYRDGYCHRLFVEQGPLYPLNSVMHHGIVHGRCFQGEKVGKSGANLKNEARSYFGTGAMLQELYLTPSMMTQKAWDNVAEAAKWAQAHSAILVDSHWVGGDPLKLEPYGYAAWSQNGAVLTLRNPSDKPSTISLDAQTVFELPAKALRTVRLKAAYLDQRVRLLALAAGKPVKIELKPFEVLVFD